MRAFADSDGDGIGDFPGATAKLDQLEQLGVEGIWLMPIHPSPSYHGYDVTDYEGLTQTTARWKI
ncbi:trehalose synthase [Bacillus sp. JCM 19046]|nr:trehalose synthase [Bacillus sp. JCM 19045]GAF18191.1 trehalose synthase [Bacillus sp. JCM 19046]